MKKLFLIVFALVCVLLINSSIFAQGVAINSDGSNADGSAMLDVKSTNSGILVPRLTFVQRNAITSPATGLMIFQTDNTSGFYYNAGTAAVPSWIRLSVPTDNFDDADSDAANEIQSLSISGHDVALSDGGGTVTVPDNNTTYSAGTGLNLAGIIFSANFGTTAGTVAEGNHTHTNMVTGTGTATRIAFWNGANSLSSNSNLYWNNTNNRLGVGTASPGSKVEILQDMSDYTTSFTSAHLNLGASNYIDNTGFVGITYDASTSANYGWSSGALRSGGGQSDFVWKHHSSSATGNERMRITSTGNVGIGTTTPSQKLHVSGNMRLTGGFYDMNNSDGASGQVLKSNGSETYWSTDNNTTYSAGNQLTLSGTTFNVTEGSGSGLDADLLDGHQWSEITGVNGWIDDGTAVRLETSSDNVGIGTTSPGVRLDVQSLGYGLPQTSSSTQTYGGLRISPPISSGNVVLDMGTNGSSGAWLQTTLRTNLASTYPLLLNPNGGNVGIGTTAPSQKLQISGNMRLTGGFYDKNNSDGASGQVLKSNGSATYWSTDNNTTYSAGNQLTLSGTTFNVTEGSGSGLDADLLDGHHWSEIAGANGWVDDGTNVRLKTSTDNVGIGTTSPTSKLDIREHTDTGIMLSLIDDNSSTGDLAHKALQVQTQGVIQAWIATNGDAYFNGNFTCTGTKSATVKTEDGLKELYCVESTENWFEDFGTAEIQNGEAVVQIKTDFEMTVTINDSNPIKVFVTPKARIGEWWVEDKGNTFVLYAPNAENGSEFDYRIVAKRKGYEDLRLKSVPTSYSDHFLYPEIKDVPAVHQQED